MRLTGIAVKCGRICKMQSGSLKKIENEKTRQPLPSVARGRTLHKKKGGLGGRRRAKPGEPTSRFTILWLVPPK